MPTLLLNLRNVPDDEAEEIRALLDTHHIAFYETPPNRWGISMGGIWIGDDDQAAHARRLLDDYQQTRARTARAEYEQRKRAGTAETLADRFRRDPVRSVLFTAIAAALLYFLVRPFFFIAGG
ncbi:MAG: DUF6164 family protein [Halofilum sp. (in: g-proteobacteria)]|nr:DUF6164 family protein [Halofilum sp. (in: g-proteobacteria)]